jgi:uncharacterized protein
MTRVGLISDTHGLLRDEALVFLAGSDHILHGGDIGGRDILDRLAAIAPLTAVRGNNDGADWASALPEQAQLLVDDVALLLVHDLKTMGRAPPVARIVVSGHSHRPSIVERNGVMFVNPGSAGPRRFRLPVSVGELLIDGGRAEARWVELAV